MLWLLFLVVSRRKRGKIEKDEDKRNLIKCVLAAFVSRYYLRRVPKQEKLTDGNWSDDEYDDSAYEASKKFEPFFQAGQHQTSFR